MIFIGGELDIAMHSPYQFGRDGMLLSMMAKTIQPMVLQLRGHRHRGESYGEN